MQCLAQCEKAVTKLEQKGCRGDSPDVPMGSKTPIDLDPVALARLDFPTGRETRFRLQRACHLVFNGLRGGEREWGNRFAGAVHYHLDGHVLSTMDAKFGPNFVTIQPSGVCVCSF